MRVQNKRHESSNIYKMQQDQVFSHLVSCRWLLLPSVLLCNGILWKSTQHQMGHWLTDNPRNLNVSYAKYVLVRSFIIRLVFRGKRLRGQWPAWLSSLVGFKVLITILSSTTKSCATRQRCVIVPVGAEWAILLPERKAGPSRDSLKPFLPQHTLPRCCQTGRWKSCVKTVHIGQFQ